MNTLIKKWKEIREFAMFSAILNGALTCRLASYFFTSDAFASFSSIMLNALSVATSVGFTTLSVRNVLKNSKKIYYARNPELLLQLMRKHAKGTTKYEFALDLQSEISAQTGELMALKKENLELKTALENAQSALNSPISVRKHLGDISLAERVHPSPERIISVPKASPYAKG